MFSFFKKSLIDGYQKIKESLGLATEAIDINAIEQTLLEQNFTPAFTKKLIEEIEKKNSKDHNWQGICKEELESIFEKAKMPIKEPDVFILLGINGSGKTTSALKIARINKTNGKKTILIPADTFRAAAQNQLEELAKEFHIDCFSHKETNPTTAIFKGAEYAKINNYQTIIIDTAGRIHQNDALLKELEKSISTAHKQFIGKKIAHYLVLDGLQGKALLTQAKQFIDAVPVDGIILTKLDGNVKPGVVCSIVETFSIPIVYLSAGQKNTDLIRFNTADFIRSLLP